MRANQIQWEIGLEISPAQAGYNSPRYRNDPATFVVTEKMDDPQEARQACIEYRLDGLLAARKGGWIVTGWDRIRRPRSCDLEI